MSTASVVTKAESLPRLRGAVRALTGQFFFHICFEWKPLHTVHCRVTMHNPMLHCPAPVRPVLRCHAPMQPHLH